MNAKDLTTVDQLREFLEGTQAVVFEVPGGVADRYQWVRQTMAKFLYPTLSRRDKGTVVRYVMKVTGYSREQVFRLIRQYVKTGKIARRERSVAQKFARRYMPADIRLLAAMDERHNTPNGLTVKKLCERAYGVFGQQAYRRLAAISVSHLYNLRRSTGYLRQRTTMDKTRPKPCAIGERRKPQPNNRPGYIRVDTVHQGDLDGHKDIPQRWATELNDFHRLHTNPYHNYHRPCLFSETVTDPKGKKRKRYPYRLLMTPYDKLKSLPQAQGFLRPGLTFQKLDALAHHISDNDAADRLNEARRLRFLTITEREWKRA